MSATIVEFRRHKNLRSRGRSVTASPPYRQDRQVRLNQQIARIEALLEELVGIGWGATDVAKSHDILAPPSGHLSHVQDESDPQPEIDHRVLERVYCLLESHK